MTHQEYNSFLRLIDMKIECAIATHFEQDTRQLEEDIDELSSVLRAHIVEED